MSNLALLRVKAAALAVRAPAFVRTPLTFVPPTVDGQPLAPETRWFLTLLKLERSDRSRAAPDDVRVEIDAAEHAFSRPARPVEIAWVDVPLPGRTLRLRTYRPPGDGPLPALLYLHGGGWVTGKPEGYDSLCSRLAEDAGCLVLSLEYRLAPEHPFPAAPDDVRDTWRWLRGQAAAFGLDPARMAVGGDSAGGNLSAVLCNELAPEEAPLLQLLLYPGTNMAEAAPSRARFASGYYLSTELVEWFERHYVPDPAERRNPRVSPLLATALGKVPALLVIAGLDPLCDEGRAYGEKLRGAGVPVETFEVPGMVHGFVNLDAILPAANAAVTELCQRVKAYFVPR